jgi:hypothetical protein
MLFSVFKIAFNSADDKSAPFLGISGIPPESAGCIVITISNVQAAIKSDWAIGIDAAINKCFVECFEFVVGGHRFVWFVWFVCCDSQSMTVQEVYWTNGPTSTTNRLFFELFFGRSIIDSISMIMDQKKNHSAISLYVEHVRQ